MQEETPKYQVEASEELELSCPKQHVQALVDVIYRSDVSGLNVTNCSLFPDGQVRCAQTCVRREPEAG